MIANFDNFEDVTNFPHKVLLTNRQVANLRHAFANYLTTDIKLSETQFFKLIQSEVLLVYFLVHY